MEVPVVDCIANSAKDEVDNTELDSKSEVVPGKILSEQHLVGTVVWSSDEYAVASYEKTCE